MPPIYCKYHRDVPARHRCPHCSISLCTGCVEPTPDSRNRRARCPVCDGDLDSLGIGNTIQPFWERIPRFFTYPANPAFLVPLSLLALASVLILFPFFLIAIAAFLVITFLMVKYGYVVLEDTAQGNLVPDFSMGQKLAEGNTRPVKQLVIFIVMFAAVIFLGSSFGPLVGLPVLIFVLLSIPASVISLGIEDDFGKALNPAHLAGIMRQIGWPYLVLCIFLLLLSSASAVAEEYVFPHMPVWLAAILGTFVTGYFTLSMFHLMGYVVYQYHEPLGYDEVKEFSNNLPASKGPHAEAHPLLNQVNILIAEGKTEEAKQRLASELASSNDPALHDRYHKLLVALNDQEGLRSHGQTYIPVLISINKLGKAVEVLTACQKSNPKFALTDASTTYSLIKYAADMQRHDTALKTLSGFAQRFAGSPHIPAAYLLAAQIMCEQKNDFAQAKKILTSLLKSYPQHALAGEIRNYLQFVERLEKPTATSSH